jgi:hypothetical protein
VNTHANRHPAHWHVEEWSVRPRKRAATEGDPKGSTKIIRTGRDAYHRVEGHATLRRRPGDLEDGEIAGDAAAAIRLGGRCTDDIISDDHSLAGDTARHETVLRLIEIEHVASVVAITEQDTGTTLAVHGYIEDLVRGRGRKNVAHHGAVSEALSDESGERWIVAGSTPNYNRYRWIGGGPAAHNATLDALNPAAVGRDEAFNHLVDELSRIVVEKGHESTA